ncbi:MAG: hypothetical protein WC479_11455 [Candidatus Izemoplasmatales bacterium]
MEKTYFNSYLPEIYYRKIKVEAVQLGVNVKDRISTILKEYVEIKYPEVKENEEN